VRVCENELWGERTRNEKRVWRKKEEEREREGKSDDSTLCVEKVGGRGRKIKEGRES
jgi:hypothetical protein